MVNAMFHCLCLIVFMSIVVNANPNYDREWESFKIKYGKVYDSVEESARRLIFIDNLKRIKAHNDQADGGLQSYRMGINQFTDQRPEEFVNTKLDTKPQTFWKLNINRTKDVPESVDWRPTIVTPVKDQGDCYSSWAFSVVAALEGAAAQKTGRLVEFSAQNLLDCTWNYGTKGCGGGFVWSALAYTKAHGGIDTEKCYPYTSSTGNDTLDCGFKPSCVGTTITNYVGITAANEDALLVAVSRGVVSASILGGVLLTYESGIIDVKRCEPALLGHSVAIVGYGSDNGKPYWIIKNSWGPDWGESGYFRMVRGKNMCMIAENAYYPVI